MDSLTARRQFNIDQPLGDAVAIVRHVLADRIGFALADESTLAGATRFTLWASAHPIGPTPPYAAGPLPRP
jgi:hypothetical protein